MKRLGPRLTIVLCLFPHTSLAEVASGEHPGVYVREGTHFSASPEQDWLLELKCILSPNTMGPDGKGEGYFLDAQLFDKRGAVSYVKAQDYVCQYDNAEQTEYCISKEFSGGKIIEYSRTNIYHTFTADLQVGHSINNTEEFAAWKKKGQLNPANHFAYHRCNCISDEFIAKHVSSMPNVLSSEDTGKLMYWWSTDPNEKSYGRAREIMTQIGRCRGNTS